MNNEMFSQQDLLEMTNISNLLLKSWQSKGFIKPSGFGGENAPLYSQETIEAATQIQKLSELGFDDEAIKKIIKKIGLPLKKKSKKNKKSEKNLLTIGDLAEQIGVSTRTIKHWEDKGIIEPDMRSEGGFRLYSKIYVYLCHLIKDLQLFGYTLEEIKTNSDYFREFLAIKNDINAHSKLENTEKLCAMQNEIEQLFVKMNQLEEGIHRWKDLLKKKKKEISGLKTKNNKRT